MGSCELGDAISLGAELLARVAEMHRLGRTAAYGTVLDTRERFARGRTLIRDNHAATVPRGRRNGVRRAVR